MEGSAVGKAALRLNLEQSGTEGAELLTPMCDFGEGNSSRCVMLVSGRALKDACVYLLRLWTRVFFTATSVL